MAKVALAVERAIESRRSRGEPGQTTSQVLASGDGWRVADVVCTSGPQDRPFEEEHTSYVIAIVLAGTFQYRSQSGHALMTPGALMLGAPGQCFECGHEHAEGDRCVAFWYSADYFERLMSDAGHRWQRHFGIPRIPPLPVFAPMVAVAATNVADSTDVPWDEIGQELAVRAVTLSPHSLPHRVPINAEGRVTRIIRTIDRRPDRPFTLDTMARDAAVSPYHFLRTFQGLTGVTPHQYILRTRLREAAGRLASSGRTIIDIALECGFGDISNFNRAFRAEFGMSPRAYRRARCSLSMVDTR